MSGLSIRKLFKAYGSVVAVDGIDLEIAEGELVVLLGPSGCGKTTTLRCIAGLEDLSDGSILIGDKVVSEKGRSLPPERREIGMVFQSYAIWPHMTVTENVAFGLKLKKLPKAEIDSKVKAALELVGLYHAGYKGSPALNVAVGIDQLRDLMDNFKRSKQPAADRTETGFAQRDLPQQDVLGARQLTVGNRRLLHLLQLPHHHRAGLRDLVGIGAKRHGVGAAVPAQIELRVHAVDQTADIAQLVIEP